MEEQLTKKQQRDLRRQEKMEKQTEQERKSRTRNLTIGIVILVIAFAIFLLIIRSSNPVQSNMSVNEIAPSDHVSGSENAPLLIVEYSDFQCPACAAYEPIVEGMLGEMGDSVALVYRHFPLRTIHSNAQEAAQAAEAAALQGKFWEMHHMLFEKQNLWSSAKDPKDYFKEYATEIGIDVDTFLSDYASSSVREKVNDDYASAVAADLNSTPSFFLNGKKLNNPRSVEEFVELLKQQFPSQEVTPIQVEANGEPVNVQVDKVQ
jgi:protein-disulfide isomerase